MEAERKKPGTDAGLQLELKALKGLAGDLQVDGLGAFAATIRFRVEAHLLVFRKPLQARSLDGGNVYEDVCAAIVGLDEAEALVGIEEFYGASLGHASGPFLSARYRRGSITILPHQGVGPAFLQM